MALVRGSQWPETRTPALIPPDVESLAGRSYRQSGQTAGALGGRRDKVDWYVDGAPPVSGDYFGLRVKVAGSAWRLIGQSARVRISEPSATMRITIKKVDLDNNMSHAMDQLLKIMPGTTEAVLEDHSVLSVSTATPPFIIPVGYLLIVTISGSTGVAARDLTIELHYRTSSVSQ